MKDKKGYIRQLFPHIEQIKDRVLQGKVVEAWLRAWKESPWGRIESAVYEPTLKVSECTLAQHTNVVTAACLETGRLIHDKLNLPVDFDVLIAGALLHDVGKLVEYAPKGERGEKTDIGKMIHHSVIGAHIALDLGIPINIVEIILAHTPANSAMPCSIEGIILDYVDTMAFDVVSFNAGHKLAISLIKRPLEFLIGK